MALGTIPEPLRLIPKLTSALRNAILHNANLYLCITIIYAMACESPVHG